MALTWTPIDSDVCERRGSSKPVLRSSRRLTTGRSWAENAFYVISGMAGHIDEPRLIVLDAGEDEVPQGIDCEVFRAYRVLSMHLDWRGETVGAEIEELECGRDLGRRDGHAHADDSAVVHGIDHDAGVHRGAVAEAEDRAGAALERLVQRGPGDAVEISVVGRADHFARRGVDGAAIDALVGRDPGGRGAAFEGDDLDALIVLGQPARVPRAVGDIGGDGVPLEEQRQLAARSASAKYRRRDTLTSGTTLSGGAGVAAGTAVVPVADESGARSGAVHITGGTGAGLHVGRRARGDGAIARAAGVEPGHARSGGRRAECPVERNRATDRHSNDRAGGDGRERDDARRSQAADRRGCGGRVRVALVRDREQALERRARSRC